MHNNRVKTGLLCCIDLLPMEPIESAHILTGDFNSAQIQEKIRNICIDRKADVILSDMMHNTTGHRTTDQLKSAQIVYDVFTFCSTFLKIHGSLICKFYRGSENDEILKLSKQLFRSVNVFKPISSRSESAEIYLIGKDYKIF